MSDRRYFTKVRNVIGGFLIFLYNSPGYYWGNLSVYVTSCTLGHVTSSADDTVNPSWVFTFSFPVWLVAMIISGYLPKYVNARILVGIAIFIQNTAFFVIYFLMDKSLPAVYIMFGILSGFGSGFYEGILLQHFVFVLSKRHASLLTTIVMAGGPTGGIFISQFVTLYTNPQNLSPDSNRGSMHVFTQTEVISRVPTMLLLLGTLSTIIQIVGLLLLQDKPSYKEEDQPLTLSDTSLSTHSSSKSTSSIFETAAKCDENKMHIVEEMSQQSHDPSVTESSTSNEDADGTDIKSYKPSEMIRSRTFYKMFIVYILGASPRIILLSYYKLYGQVWINDDHFLTQVGTAVIVVQIPAIVMWGFVMDRIGVTSSLVIIYAGSALSLLSMYFSARLDRWFYFVSAACASLNVNMYTCFSLATFRWFGKDFYTVNFAIVKIGSTCACAVTSLVVDSLITKFGHFFEFGMVTSPCVLGLVIIVLCFPRG